MSCVLISFLGTGPSHGHKRGEYMLAKYRFPETGHEYESPFVADVICQEYKVDKVLLVGTMHSIWDGVYDYFTQKAGKEPDLQVWEAIYSQCQQANHASEVGKIIHHDKLEQALGKGSKAVTIHYGITADEIERNSAIILALEQYMQQGDELIIDITHSFRSLPMYIMNLLMYLQHVSEKKLTIKHICYGMLDVAKELSFAPIVELKNILQVNDWISGAYSFKQFGNAYKIAALIERDPSIANPKMFSTPLIGFTEAKNLNHLAELENQVRKLQILRNSDGLPLIATMVISPVVEEFLKTVKLNEGSFKHSDFQYQLAIWQRNNHNYAAAYISLNEAIVTRACELCGVDSTDFQERKNMTEYVFPWARRQFGAENKLKNEGVLQLVQECYDRATMREYASLYKKVSKNRNAIAHSLKETNGRVTNTVNNMIRDLEDFIRQYNTKLQC